MAVFTTVTQAQAQSLASRLNVGEVLALQGIAGGIENTNYFLSTQKNGVREEWVLTLFERLSFEQLPFYLELMQHLASKGLTVPAPQPDADGHLVHELCGKPAAIVNRLAGASALAPTVAHCTQLGTQLAHMHLAAQDFKGTQPNLRSLDWWQTTLPSVLPHVDGDLAALLKNELQHLEALYASPAYALLPRAAVHCDLFRDNALFVENASNNGLQQPRLSGFFDFYFAGVDTLVFDMAVCINDWCIDLPTGALDLPRVLALVQAYQAVRPLSADECTLLPDMLRAGGFRFWLSRLWDWHLPRDASMLKPHDPKHFERIVRTRRAGVPDLFASCAVCPQ